MKRLTLLILGITCFIWTQAQEVQVGPQFGMNMTDNQFDKVNAGGIVNMDFSELFSLRSGILYSQKGNGFRDFDYLHLPVTPQWNFGNRLKAFIRGGGYTALSLNPNNVARTVDLGLEIGTGLKYPVGPGEAMLDLSYGTGILHPYANPEDYSATPHIRALSLSAGYLFNLDQNHSD